MNCRSCGRATRPGARFCSGCGKPVVPRCPACGAESEPGAQFCDACGAGLAAGPVEASVARKIVTIVFADLIGSTALHERLDAESARRLMDRYYRVLHAAVDAHGGTVVKLLGDGVMAAFGVPRVAEDDAIRAVRAAVGMQHAFRDLVREPSALVEDVGLRVAVNTGEVVVSDDNADVVGDPVNVAARLQQEARDGDVVIGEATRRLVSELVTLAPLGAVTLKGRSETVAAYRVVSLDRPAGVAASAFVGREEELRRITAVYDAAVSAPSARLAVILGSPGLGKSRLLDEFTRRLGGGATVLTARCDVAGSATFAPLAGALRGFLGLDDDTSGSALRAAIDAALPGDDAERSRIAMGITALLAATPASPEETFFVVRRFLAGLATVQPVVFAIDDLQWAEPLLLDLTEHLVQWSSGVPLLVLVAARPELRDARSALAAPGGLVADVVTLAGLDASAATRLAANVVGASELPAALAGRVLATSEGNPLFVGELVRMLVQDGALKLEGDRWVAGSELAGLEMPPTIQALLAARIERLRPEERIVLERAAVVGRHFSRAVVAQLLPQEVIDLDTRLEALRRSELIEPDAGWYLGEPALRFHHVLIRDAAYRRLLKGTRAELHSRVADWIEARVGEAVEHDETLGWHLEQAHQHLRELGPIDAPGRVIGERAARYLAAAGRRALARDDLPLAASLLGRAVDRLDAADPARADLALDWCEALLSAGDVGPAAKAVAELGRFISEDPADPNGAPSPTHLLSVGEGRGEGTSAGEDRVRLHAWHTCFAGQLAVLTDPQALRATADAVAGAAEELVAVGDAAGEAKAHSVHANALARLGKVGAAEAALDRALAAARRAHDRRRANTVLAGAPLAALWGPSPVTRASGRCLDVVRVLRITQGAPAVEAVALRCQGVLEALRGRTEAARRMIASSRRMVEELGITQRLLEADVFAGLIELLEGEAVAAERCLRPTYEGLRNHGLGIDAAQAAALLGRALLAQGRADAAEVLSHASEELAGDDLKAAIAWRGVRAEALARRGEHAAAVELARAAVDIAAATDALLDHADARLALAAALRAAGHRADANAEEARAIELWEAKGATLLAARARRGVGRVDVREDELRSEPSIEHTGSVGIVLSPPAEPPGLRRRVRPNDATASAARLDAAIAARDAAVLPTLLADRMETVHHPTGVVYDREGALAAWQALLAAQDLRFAHEPLATLGASLALFRTAVSFSGLPDNDVGLVGAASWDEVILIEVDARGQRTGVEFFSADRLTDAVIRLYERYADLVRDGFSAEEGGAQADSARGRAQATSRAVGALLGPPSIESYRTAMASDVEWVDHRILGFPSGRGIEPVMQLFRLLFESSTDVVVTVNDILGLHPDALLMRIRMAAVDRTAGGTYERAFLLLWNFGRDGLVSRTEQWDLDRESDALARFEELTAEPLPARLAPSPSRAAGRLWRRVRSNAATANAARMDAAVVARDADAFLTMLADEAENVHHPTGTTFRERDAVDSYRLLFRADDVEMTHTPLASLGVALALCRSMVSFSASTNDEAPFGAVETENILLIEVDSRGRRVRTEFFALDRLNHAVVRLYECYADLLPEGPEHTRAVATARSVAAQLGRFDVDSIATAVAPMIEFIDHRSLGFSARRGAETFLHGLRSLLDVATDVTTRVDDILALRPDALLVRWTNVGTARVGGGAYENHFLMLFVFAADGLVMRNELFDPDPDDEALARFDELTGESRAPSTPPSLPATQRRVRPNAASAGASSLDAAVAAGDADALAAAFAEVREFVDHATGATYDGHALLTTWQALLQAEEPSVHTELLATLGDSLALCRGTMSFRALDDFGAVTREEIILIEVGPGGRQRRAETFATDHLADGVARLYSRHAELLPDGVARDRAAVIARSVAAQLGPFMSDSMAATFVPDVEFVDHRTLGLFGPMSGAPAVLQRLRSLLEASPDIATRVEDVLALCADVLLVRWRNFGTERAGGGAYEYQFLMLFAFGSDGRVTRNELFDADCDDEALARFDELTMEPAMRVRFEGTDRSVGPSQVEWLEVFEVDDRGDAITTVGFDPDDLDAAYAELDERYAAGNAADSRRAKLTRAFSRAFAARDWKTLAALLAPNLVVTDHRLLGWETLHGPAAYVEALKSLVDLAPDVQLRIDHVTMSAPRFLYGTTWVGTHEGGSFESPSIILCELDTLGRIRRFDQYDLDRLDEVRASFAAIDTSATRDALRIPPNGATRAGDRFREFAEARDWEALTEIHAPSFVFEDRRRLMRDSGDRDKLVASVRVTISAGVQTSGTTLATAGDRLRLERVRFFAVEGTTLIFETVTLQITEIDAEGRIVAAITFDPDDRRAAALEMFDRYFRGEGARWTPASQIEFVRALNDHDLDRMRATLSDDFFFHDHRRTGVGRIGNVDDYVASIAAVYELSIDVMTDTLYHVAVDQHGSLSVGRLFGTLVDGGAFESIFVRLNLYQDGRGIGAELFEIEDLEVARARFEELRPHGADPLQIPPNAATRAGDLLEAAREALDLEAIAAMCAPTMVFDDRRRGVLLTGDRETFIATNRLMSSPRLRASRTVLATTGDHLALRHIRWTGTTADGVAFENENLSLMEVDAAGRIAAIISFDVDDRRSASLEMLERYARSEEAKLIPTAAFDGMRAMNDHDLDRVRATVPPDVVIHDHRRTGLGRLDAAAFTASLAVLFELAPDLTLETLYTVAVQEHGELIMARMFGTLTGGGEFETVYARLGLHQGDRIVGMELFEPEDLDIARARLAELRGIPRGYCPMPRRA